MQFFVPVWAPYKGEDLEPLLYRFREVLQLKKSLFGRFVYSSTDVYAGVNEYGEVLMSLGKRIVNDEKHTGKFIYCRDEMSLIDRNRPLLDVDDNKKLLKEHARLSPVQVSYALTERVNERWREQFGRTVSFYLKNLFGCEELPATELPKLDMSAPLSQYGRAEMERLMVELGFSEQKVKESGNTLDLERRVEDGDSRPLLRALSEVA